MADLEIDGGEMAALADKLAGAARDASDARDWVVNAWGMDWCAPDPLHEAYVAFCQTWVTGTDSAAQYTQFAAEYTQAVANAFCAMDQKLAAGYDPLHDQGSMPKGYYDQPAPTGPVA